MEVYKVIKCFDNYSVSNYGNVKRLENKVLYSNGITAIHKERILKQEITKGYNRVSLSVNNKISRFQVHRLVAESFIHNTENKPCVNHLDGNGLNNNVSNLEWCTHSENEIHSYDVLGKVNHNRKLNSNQVEDIRANCIKGVFPFNKVKGNVSSFINKYNVDRSTILNVLNDKYYV